MGGCGECGQESYTYLLLQRHDHPSVFLSMTIAGTFFNHMTSCDTFYLRTKNNAMVKHV